MGIVEPGHSVRQTARHLSLSLPPARHNPPIYRRSLPFDILRAARYGRLLTRVIVGVSCYPGRGSIRDKNWTISMNPTRQRTPRSFLFFFFLFISPPFAASRRIIEGNEARMDNTMNNKAGRKKREEKKEEATLRTRGP